MDWAQQTVRREEGGADRFAHRPKFHLFLVMECMRPLAGGARHELSDVDEVVIGRAPARTATRQGRRLTLGVPDPMMSSTHARIAGLAGGWILRDAGSTNGTSARSPARWAARACRSTAGRGASASIRTRTARGRDHARARPSPRGQGPSACGPRRTVAPGGFGQQLG